MFSFDNHRRKYIFVQVTNAIFVDSNTTFVVDCIWVGIRILLKDLFNSLPKLFVNRVKRGASFAR